ncbi:MAG: hypothetical protein ACYSX0_14925 [Planctomycetota bacterium]
MDDGARARPADRAVDGLEAIDAAIACAEIAIPEPFVRPLDAPLELAAFE